MTRSYFRGFSPTSPSQHNNTTDISQEATIGHGTKSKESKDPESTTITLAENPVGLQVADESTNILRVEVSENVVQIKENIVFNRLFTC